MEWKKIIAIGLGCLTSFGVFASELNEDEEEQAVEHLYVPKVYEENLDNFVVKDSVHLSRFIQWNQTEIVLLDDDSVWMVHPLETRIAGWWDRLRGTQIMQPEERFLSKPSQWKEDAHLKVYNFSWKKSGLEKIYEFDATRLIYCTHLLENVATGGLVFARQLKNAHIVQLFDSWIRDVKSKGFVEGYEKGYNDAKQI